MEKNNDPKEQRTIGYIEGRLEGLATKDFVRETVLTAIDKQTEVIDKKFDAIGEQITELRNEVTKGRDWRNKVVGGGTLIILLISSFSSLKVAGII